MLGVVLCVGTTVVSEIDMAPVCWGLIVLGMRKTVIQCPHK